MTHVASRHPRRRRHAAAHEAGAPSAHVVASVAELRASPRLTVKASPSITIDAQRRGGVPLTLVIHSFAHQLVNRANTWAISYFETILLLCINLITTHVMCRRRFDPSTEQIIFAWPSGSVFVNCVQVTQVWRNVFY